MQEYPAAGAIASAAIVPDIFKYALVKAGFNEQHFICLCYMVQNYFFCGNGNKV